MWNLDNKTNGLTDAGNRRVVARGGGGLGDGAKSAKALAGTDGQAQNSPGG